MPPVYFLAALVVAAGSVCCADEGVAKAKLTEDSHSSVYCPGSSCNEICKCNSEYGTTSCRGNCTIFLKLGYCMNLFNGSVAYGPCPCISSEWRIDEPGYYSFEYNKLNNLCGDLNREKNLCSS